MNAEEEMTLTQLLISDLPPGFVRAVLDQFPLIYSEAHEVVHNNPDYGKPEAEYLLGHQRRALGEASLRNLAVEHGLKVEMLKPEKGGCEHVMITVGRFKFTLCHVASQGAFPKSSPCREQYSLINEHLSQGQLFPIESDPSDADIYAVLVHTGVPGKNSNFKSIAVGFPNHTFDAWLDAPINLLDISDLQGRRYQQKEDLQQQVQSPRPEWKKNAKKNTGKGEN